MQIAVFLDRDGVINENLDGDYVKSWDEFVFLPGALAAIRRLVDHGTLVIVISNQAGVGKGLMAPDVVEEVHQRMVAESRSETGQIAAVYWCPHTSEDRCDCRKPNPGLLLQAARDWGLDLEQCYLVGDALTDIEAGQSVGCITILVRTGCGRRTLKMQHGSRARPDFVVHDLAEAVELILNDDSRGDGD